MNVKDEFTPIEIKLRIVLAEDDPSDRLLFKDAIESLPLNTELIFVVDGEQLLQLLKEDVKKLPDVVFLDLNMPRKNGFAALGEIKRNNQLQDIPVIIFSSIMEEHKVKQIYKDAAHYLINKPSDFMELRRVIYKILNLIATKTIQLPNQEGFVITKD